ncbi:hypothetical protein FE257_012183 [Aspergillus nanangensis]|uniref:Amine oxidase domain-containing protein n=1 Tax=Aspergillus nanangensis TaxID=2582783 RepID=A0AAD4GQZ5_ASPNN|nr:hypothetical protein FE257_012183 [Aspergillus nanangensis]
MSSPKKVAIVGSGAAGIAALWALHYHSPHHVSLYEAADRLGGHTNTVEFEKDGYRVPVDTGFIVLNRATYRLANFLSFLRAIDVPTALSEMTFSVSRDSGAFEWAGTSLQSIFAQRKNLFSTDMWLMLFDIIRFNYYALDVLREGQNNHTNTLTIGEYLDRERYSQSFRDNYLIPMTAAIWSTSPEKTALEFPAVTLIRFMWNHHLLSTLATRPEWRTLPHGAKRYIDAVLSHIPSDRIHLNHTVQTISPDPSSSQQHIRLTTTNNQTHTFDHVILATHAPQALSMISSSATPTERALLSAFQTSPNTAVLHSDESLLPRCRRTWSSWNYLTTSQNTQVSLTYNMNKLQHIPSSRYGSVLVTLNPLRAPDPDTVQGVYEYAHPLYTRAVVDAQEQLHNIQGIRGVSYAGAWTRYGFHEDAVTSGLRAAVEDLGARIPFGVVDSTHRRGGVRELTWVDGLFRLVMQGVLWVLGCFGGGRKKQGKGKGV